MSLTLPIVIGRKYVRRDRTVVTARERHPNIDDDQVYAGARQDADQDPYEHVNANTGLAYRNAKYPSDLIADHVETAGCPHAALMLEYAQDAMKTAEPWKMWEVIRNDVAVTDTVVDLTDHPGWNPKFQYRRKPRTIRIGEFDVPEPLRDVPADGTHVYSVNTTAVAPVMNAIWSMDGYDLRMLERGLSHLTREAAEQHARALLSFTEQK